MSWAKIVFEPGAMTAGTFRAALTQLMMRLPDEDTDHMGVYRRQTLEGGIEFILSPLAARAVARAMPEYPLCLCGQPPSGLKVIFGPFASDPAWFDLPPAERNAQIKEAETEHLDLLAELGFLEDDQQPGEPVGA